MALTSAARTASDEVRAGKRVPQFTVCLLFALTSSTVNDLITQLLSFLSFLTELGVLVQRDHYEVVDGGTQSRFQDPIRGL